METENKRLLVVGTQLNPGCGTTLPLGSESGRRISQMMGESLHHVAHVANLFEPHEEVSLRVKSRVDEWVRWAARNDVERVVFLVMPHRYEQRFKDKVCVWLPAGGERIIEAAFCPHTSGVNRWWNVEANRKKGQEFWREIGAWLRGEE